MRPMAERLTSLSSKQVQSCDCIVILPCPRLKHTDALAETLVPQPNRRLRVPCTASLIIVAALQASSLVRCR